MAMQIVQLISGFSVFFLLLTNVHRVSLEGGTLRNPIRFPFGGPFMGFFVAIAIPLELEEEDVFLSYNFEANYNLPENQTTYDYPPILSRSASIARKFVYDAFEFKLKSHGLPGKQCLLRMICEGAEYSFENTGVLSDIIHIILTPSSSKGENLKDYESAEKYGKLYKHCKKYHKKCTISILDLVSMISHLITE